MAGAADAGDGRHRQARTRTSPSAARTASRILPPDVNESREDFTVVARRRRAGIRFGLGAVQGVGAKAIEIDPRARATRTARSPSLADFCNARRAAQQVEPRGRASRVADQVRRLRLRRRDARASSSTVPRHDVMQWAATAAEEDTDQIDALRRRRRGAAARRRCRTSPPWSDKELLTAEQRDARLLHHRAIRSISTRTTSPLHQRRRCDRPRARQARPEQGRRSAASSSACKLKNSKKGDRYATFNLEDKTGTVEVIVLARDLPQVRGPHRHRRADLRHRHARGRARSAARSSPTRSSCSPPTAPARPRKSTSPLRAERVTEDAIRDLKQTLAQHSGDCPCFLHLLLPNKTETIIALPRDLRVAATEGMVEAVEQLFGRGVASLQ